MGTGERAINVKQTVQVQVQTEVHYRVQCSISIVRDYYYQKRGLPCEKNCLLIASIILTENLVHG